MSLIDHLDKLLGAHGGTGPNYEYHCPFCADRRGDESPHKKLRVNPDKGKAMCFRCEYAAGSMETLLKAVRRGKLTSEDKLALEGRVEHIPVARIRDEILVRFYAHSRVDALRPVPLPKLTMYPMRNGPTFQCQSGFAYLRQRGCDEALALTLAKKHDLHYAWAGDYACRIVFPVWQGGKVVYFTTRFCGNHHAKALNPPNVPGFISKEHCLLNYDGCVGAKRVAIVEGGFSMMAFDYAVGLMGKRISPQQIALLETLVEQGTEEFLIAVDPDAAKQAYQLQTDLRGRVPKLSYVPLPQREDPWDCRERIEELIETRRPMTLADRVAAISPRVRGLLTIRPNRTKLQPLT